MADENRPLHVLTVGPNGMLRQEVSFDLRGLMLPGKETFQNVKDTEQQRTEQH